VKIFERLRNLTSIIWIVSELALALIIFSVLLFLLLGESSGVFVTSITENSIYLLREVGAESIIGVTIVFFVYFYLRQRSK
tara:strand:- start:161 stop:403 length:243 start_codon:yes stop_codon:yes gene_type:complete